jgi:hypothetical protein
MRAMVLEHHRLALNVTGQEWETLEPLVAEVLDTRMAQFQKQFEARQGEGAAGLPEGQGRGRRGGTRRGGGAGPGGKSGMPPGPGPGGRGGHGMGVPPEAEALIEALDDENATDAEIQVRLDAFRAERQKRREEMEAQHQQLEQEQPHRRSRRRMGSPEPSAELLAAQAALKAAVTVRQEAELVLMRTLQ